MVVAGSYSLCFLFCSTDSINIKILNAGAWARGSDRVTVSLPLELEDYIPEVEEFYRKKHSGRKLQWHHHMSNGTVSWIYSIFSPVFIFNFLPIICRTDSIRQWCRKVWSGRDHVPNGRVVRMERASQGEDFVGESSLGHWITRCWTSAYIMGAITIF